MIMARNVQPILDCLFYCSLTFLLAKATGVICLIGLGFGLTSWIVYRFYLDTRHKKKRKPSVCVEEGVLPETGTDTSYDHFVMGNQHAVSAGIKICVEDHEASSGVRHRQTLKQESSDQQSAVTASIVERESGAYITRCMSPEASQDVWYNDLGYDLQQNERSTHVDPSHDAGCYANGVSGQTTEDLKLLANYTSMDDSGYLDLDGRPNSYSDTQRDSLLPGQSHLEVGRLEAQLSEPLKLDRKYSNVSDQIVHDLVSDFSSGRGSEQDEDVLSIEIYGIVEENPVIDPIIDPDLASTETLLGSLALDEPISDQSATVTLSHDTCESSSDVGTKDCWTDSSDLWKDDRCSPCMNSSKSNSQQEFYNENLNWSSAHSSPLFIPRSNHSRTSSITSADVDLETTHVESQTNGDLEKMEIELIELRQEIYDIEEKLDSLMSTDTTKLYFNVDNLKKLTEVVLNSDDVQLTSSEIAKAFHILRKYRYTFSTPEKKPFAHNEAECPVTKDVSASANKSLPYLDLAEGSSMSSSSSKSKDLSDWVDSVSIPNTTAVITQWDIEEFCFSQPILQRGYQQLSEDYGFTNLYLVKMEHCAFQASAFVSAVLHNQLHQLASLDLNTCYKDLEEISSSHFYISGWRFKHLSTNCTSPIGTMKICIKTLLLYAQRLAVIEDNNARRIELLQLFNVAESTRSLILEGIRILQFVKVCSLYNSYVSNTDFPLYTWLLFARETSGNPRSYFLNYIQADTALLPDQIDTELLADVLGVKLQTFHPTKPERQDFMAISQGEFLSDCKISVPLAIHSLCSYAIPQ